MLDILACAPRGFEVKRFCRLRAIALIGEMVDWAAMFAQDCSVSCANCSVDGLVIFFRGMMGCQVRGEEQISAIRVVVYVIVDGRRVWRCGRFWPYDLCLICSGPVFHQRD